MGRFQIKGATIPKGGMSAPKFGGGNNGLERLIAQQNMLLDKQQNIGSTIANVNSEFPSGTPVGTNITEGNLHVPLNSALDDDSRQTIAADAALEPTINQIKEKLSSFGPSDSGFIGDMQRTGKQMVNDSGIPLLTSQSPEMQDIQGLFNHLKTILPFASGGKNLTPTEKKLVFVLLDTTGKRNEQIGTDLDRAMGIIKGKAKLATGGMQAAKSMGTSPIPGSPGYQQQQASQDDVQAKKDRLLQRYRTGK